MLTKTELQKTDFTKTAQSYELDCNGTQFLFERGVPPLRRRETKGIIQDHHFAMRDLLFDSASFSVLMHQTPIPLVFSDRTCHKPHRRAMTHSRARTHRGATHLAELRNPAILCRLVRFRARGLLKPRGQAAEFFISQSHFKSPYSYSQPVVSFLTVCEIKTTTCCTFSFRFSVAFQHPTFLRFAFPHLLHNIVELLLLNDHGRHTSDHVPGPFVHSTNARTRTAPRGGHHRDGGDVGNRPESPG